MADGKSGKTGTLSFQFTDAIIWKCLEVLLPVPEAGPGRENRLSGEIGLSGGSGGTMHNEAEKDSENMPEKIKTEKVKTKKTKVRKEPPKRSVLEEVGNAVTHGVGALLGIAGLVLMLIRSDTGIRLLSSLVYGFCMIMMFLMSCLYHAFKWGTAVKRLWRRFDYISIYLLIAGTFTPLWLLYQGGTWGTALCIAQWVITITGITLIGVFGPEKVRAIHMTLYIVMGWSGLVFLPRMIQDNLPLFFFILGGGVLYTLGIIPFALKKKGAHFIWHFFVLFGAVAHWLGIYLYLY